MTSDARFNGSGTVDVSGELVVASSAVVQFDSTTDISGQLTLSGSASASAGATMNWHPGARLKSNTGGGAVVIAAGGAVKFTAGATSYIEGEIGVNGAATVQAQSQTSVGVGGKLSGSGTWTINGRLNLNAGASVANSALAFSLAGGEMHVDAAATATFASFKMDSSSKLYTNLDSSTGAWTTIAISGNMTASGNLYVDVPHEPTSIVVLINANAGISGTVTATVTAGVSGGRRLLASGTVVQKSNTIEYYPAGTAPPPSPGTKTSSGSTLSPLSTIAILPAFALW
jgi:hypothetical protein